MRVMPVLPVILPLVVRTAPVVRRASSAIVRRGCTSVGVITAVSHNAERALRGWRYEALASRRPDDSGWKPT